MAKYHGKIGFVTFEETVPGVMTERPIEREYFGDVLQSVRRWEASKTLNDNLQIANRISIVADAYAKQNIYAMRYISWMGSYWKITSAEVEHPRVILTVGDVYNGQTVGTAGGFRDADGEGSCVLPAAPRCTP